MTVATTERTPARNKLKVLGLGSGIDTMWALREEKRVATEVVKSIEAKIEAHTELMFGLMDAQKLDKAAGRLASVSIGSVVVASVENWELFWAYIIKNKYTHLLQKRVSDPAYRELLELKKIVPGVLPFTKRTLNLRSITS